MRHQKSPFTDPIERERVIREREEFVETLFHPLWGGSEWKLDWLVDGLIPIGYLAILAGPPKSGKTCLATALALSVANGLPFAGRSVRQGGVLWVSAEESPRERRLLLERSTLAAPTTPLYTCYQRLAINEHGNLTAIAKWAMETEARLLVVDPLIACVGHSLSDSYAARRSLQELKVFAETNRLAVLVLHHEKRDGRVYRRSRVADNAQLAATASMNIVLSSVPIVDNSRDGGSTTGRLIMLDCYGRGDFANDTVYLVSRGPLDYHPTQSETQTQIADEPRQTFAEQKIVEYLQSGPRGAKAIFANTPLAIGTVRNSLTCLRRKGIVRVIKVGKNPRIYALVKPKDVDLSEPGEPDDKRDDKTQEFLPATQA